MVSSTILTARSRSSGGCRCPDPCFVVSCFDAAMGYILPKNAASIEPRAVQPKRDKHTRTLNVRTYPELMRNRLPCVETPLRLARCLGTKLSNEAVKCRECGASHQTDHNM